MPLIFLFFCGLSPALASDCKDSPQVLPRYSKFVASKKMDYEKLNGKIKYQEFSVENLKKICNFVNLKNPTKLFSRSSSVSFIVKSDCRSNLVFQKPNEKALNHTILAGEDKIIGGGYIQCKDGNYYITNNSSRYCFPIEPLRHVIQELKNQKIREEEIFVKFKQKKFCAKSENEKLETKRSKKYLFGYKKSHIINGRNFLNLFSK